MMFHYPFTIVRNPYLAIPVNTQIETIFHQKIRNHYLHLHFIHIHILHYPDRQIPSDPPLSNYDM